MDTIIAGVGMGGLTDKYDIKILICYLLNSIDEKLTKEQLDFVFQDGQYANYFSYCDAFAELLTSNHISFEEKDNIINLNELGIETAKKLFTSLPASLRDNVVTTTMGLLAQLKNERENESTIVKYNNGYMVKCIIHDIDYDLLSFDIYAPDILQAEKIKMKFQQNPTKLYKNLIEYLIY